MKVAERKLAGRSLMQGHTLRELTVENPMLVEVTRFRRKFLALGVNNSSNVISGILFFAVFAGLNILVMSMRGAMPPVAIMYIQAAIFTFMVPATLYQSIAGERERRTWDVLLVAPISKAQIVIGKFMASGFGILAIAALLLIPTIFAGILFERWSILAILKQELVTISFGFLVASITILFSARAKRALVGLGITLGILTFGLVLFPALMASLGLSDMGSTTVLLFLHPFWAIAQINDPMASGSNWVIDNSWYGLYQTLVYLLFTGIFLAWATNTLVFAENDVAFLPKAKTNA